MFETNLMCEVFQKKSEEWYIMHYENIVIAETRMFYIQVLH